MSELRPFYIYMGKEITIAIDGFSACGKSTLAKDLAKKLEYVYVDSGAMYRAVTLYLLQNQIDILDENAIIASLQKITIALKHIDGVTITYLNGKDVEDQIRSKEINEVVSEVARISEVRHMLVDQQRQFSKEQGIVMDGRDIGSVVFPNAELKVFLTCEFGTRVERRKLESDQKGLSMSVAEIRENLSHRDRIDSTRKDSPLTKTEDAIHFDNTNMTRDQWNLSWSSGSAWHSSWDPSMAATKRLR